MDPHLSVAFGPCYDRAAEDPAGEAVDWPTADVEIPCHCGIG